MTEEEFEDYWKKSRIDILSKSKEYQQAKENFKIKSGADLLLFGIPIAVGVVCTEYLPLGSEMLKWGISAIFTILCFAVCSWIKGLITGSGSPDEIEARLKEYARKDMCQ